MGKILLALLAATACSTEVAQEDSTLQPSGIDMNLAQTEAEVGQTLNGDLPRYDPSFNFDDQFGDCYDWGYSSYCWNQGCFYDNNGLYFCDYWGNDCYMGWGYKDCSSYYCDNAVGCTWEDYGYYCDGYGEDCHTYWDYDQICDTDDWSCQTWEEYYNDDSNNYYCYDYYGYSGCYGYYCDDDWGCEDYGYYCYDYGETYDCTRYWCDSWGSCEDYNYGHYCDEVSCYHYDDYGICDTSDWSCFSWDEWWYGYNDEEEYCYEWYDYGDSWGEMCYEGNGATTCEYWNGGWEYSCEWYECDDSWYYCDYGYYGYFCEDSCFYYEDDLVCDVFGGGCMSWDEFYGMQDGEEYYTCSEWENEDSTTYYCYGAHSCHDLYGCHYSEESCTFEHDSNDYYCSYYHCDPMYGCDQEWYGTFCNDEGTCFYYYEDYYNDYVCDMSTWDCMTWDEYYNGGEDEYYYCYDDNYGGSGCYGAYGCDDNYGCYYYGYYCNYEDYYPYEYYCDFYTCEPGYNNCDYTYRGYYCEGTQCYWYDDWQICDTTGEYGWDCQTWEEFMNREGDEFYYCYGEEYGDYYTYGCYGAHSCYDDETGCHYSGYYCDYDNFSWDYDCQTWHCDDTGCDGYEYGYFCEDDYSCYWYDDTYGEICDWYQCWSYDEWYGSDGGDSTGNYPDTDDWGDQTCDTDNGVTDEEGRTCLDYWIWPELCGYNSAGFDSSELCYVCGGGNQDCDPAEAFVTEYIGEWQGSGYQSGPV